MFGVPLKFVANIGVQLGLCYSCRSRYSAGKAVGVHAGARAPGFASADYQPSAEATLSNKEAEGLQSGIRESVPVVNGVQSAKHENGLSAKGQSSDFEEIIQLSNHGSSVDKMESGISPEPILAFEAGEPFLKKAGSIKPQHVAEVLVPVRHFSQQGEEEEP
ncbi:MAP7 domain-containing protein 1-like isoform X1 [Arapaima gigas]